ncbi:MAG: glycine--tRNA ligase subunit beta, partial [Vagococcus sp.]
TIESCVEKLKYVTFHEKIGSMYEKMERVSAISHLIGTSINLTEQELVDLKRASSIYKFDLVTNMVDEFPELQGVIGEKYAITQGENKAVSCAIREHYLPVSSDGVLPQSNVGAVLAIADKIDTLFTFFTVGLNPTGSNDPYALRRQTYGIIRIVENKEWSFPLIQLQHDIEKLINKDNQRFGLSIEDPKQLIHAFLKGRMKQWFSGKNLRHDIIEAVVESQQDDINQMFEIANILNENVNQDEFKGTVEALTRVINLAKKTEFKHTNDVDSHLFETKSEKELYDAVEMIKLNRADYTLNELFGVLVNLRPLINVYFDENMIMVDDEKIRNNRLSQLTDIAKLSLAFASIDRLLLK